MEINLKIPLFGLKVTHKGEKLFHEEFCVYSKNQRENIDAKIDQDKERGGRIQELEKNWGDYIKFTGRLEEVLNLMFPTTDDIQGIAKLISQRQLNVKKQKSLPLFSYDLENLIKISKVGKEQWASAWANLMYELGEFKLDEIILEKNKETISCLDIDEVIPYIYKFENNWYVWWANILDARGTIRGIWERITGDEVQIIAVDDDPNFSDLFFGNKPNSPLLSIGPGETKKLYSTGLGHSLIWINPGTPYSGDNVKKQIRHIIKQSKKDLLVFVIDLIFKKGPESNIIKGDGLIKYLRNFENDRNVQIVGFTGGSSPFIINSAEKAGADIVVFKNRGGDPENKAGHSSGGSPVGVFDLLWAISWNVSVWRLLEEYKRNYLKNEKSEFENIARKFFSSTENASPFWKKYLDEWKTEINNEKINRLFR